MANWILFKADATFDAETWRQRRCARVLICISGESPGLSVGVHQQINKKEQKRKMMIKRGKKRDK